MSGPLSVPIAGARIAPARARVLMVDDRPANLLALEGVLTPLGHELVRANSGEEALKCLLREDFALILLDVQMPGIDGFETAALIKQRERSRFIPIIFVTAISRDAPNVFKGYECGAVDYLLKPFDPGILRSKVSVFVELYLKGEQIKEQTAQIARHEREASERRSDDRFRSLIDAMAFAVLAAKADGTIYYANHRWTHMTGIDSGRLDLSKVVHPDDWPAANAAFEGAIRQARQAELHFRVRRVDGAWRWHFCRMAPKIDGQGKITGWITTAIDVDEAKRAEDERTVLLERARTARESAETARETAETANRAKDEFLATVSHELRTPLNAILGWTRMLRMGMLEPAKVERALETVERNAQAQTELIEDLLDVSRIIAGKFRIQHQDIDLGTVVLAAAESFRPTALLKGVELQTKIDRGGRSFTGDPDRLQQVVWNLLSNAIKFTPIGGRVLVALSPRGSYLELVVKDDGEGIPQDFLPFVFDRFRQADGSTTRKKGGLGLGLAIVRHLVELHGGTIDATSEGPGKGSCFTALLPIRVLRADDPTNVSDATRSERTKGMSSAIRLDDVHVLYVDDDAGARDLLSELFRLRGASVTAVASTAEALASFESSKPDVIVSDIGLPNEDGYSLIRRIRALPPEKGGLVPAIAVIGFARAEDNKRALAEGFQVHLTKPIEPQELMELVGSLTGRL